MMKIYKNWGHQLVTQLMITSTQLLSQALQARKIGLMAAFLAISSVLLAQERVVTGTVTDETGAAMPGVNILLKGTAQGTASDTEGKFSITIPNNDAVLVFNFVGYGSSEVIVGERTVLNTQLTPDVQTLTELVVTGYTSQRKADITGAVAVVDPEQLKSFKSANVSQMLNGRAPGVTVSGSGEPGTGTNILIRGVNSFGSSDPLIIVDGVQIQGDKALNGINPNDIESMQVLKDAASASIYGARAAAGVIIVTTKQGKSGKIQVNYNGYYGQQKAVGAYSDFLVKDPLAYAQQWHTIKNPGSGAFYGGVGSAASIPDVFYADPSGNPYNYPTDPRLQPTLYMNSNKQGTDWWAETFHPAPIQNHNLSLSGGSDKGTMSASVDYFKQEGTMKFTYFERISARLNGTLKLGKFTFGESMGFTRSVSVGMPGGPQNEQNAMTQILKMNSIVPVYDVSGVHYGGAKTVNFSNGTNPLAMVTRNANNTNTTYRLIGGFNGAYQITSFLSVKSALSYDLSQNLQKSFIYPTWENREFNGNNQYGETQNVNFNWVWTNTLNFQKVFANDHNVSAFVGYEAVRNEGRFMYATVQGFGTTNPDIVLNVSQPLSTVLLNAGSGYSYLGTLASMFGKVDYSYKDKYLFSATVRRDGSSNFGPNKRYGVFPAVSVGWRISEESFLQGTSWLDDLKLRAGYGVTGNQIIPAFNAYDRWGARSPWDASYDITGSNTGSQAGYTLTNYGNPNTQWEENRMVNIGLDATILNGKFSIVFDYFDKDTKGLLYKVTYPGVAGNAVAPYKNVAEMTNKGFDGAVNYKDKIGEVGFNIGVNFSHYKNTIVSLDGDTKTFLPGGVDFRFGVINAWQVGSPISSFYGLQTNGLFQNAAEVAALDQGGQSALGRIKFRDLNGDGKIDDADRGVIASPQPKATIGLNLGANYKAFDFSMFLFGSFGNKIYNYNRLFTHFGFFNSNVAKEVLTNSWTPTDTNHTLPILDPNDSESLLSSTFYVEDGSYIRAQNMTVGYTVPKIKGIQKLRIYVQGQNMFTITKYKGIDPALSNVNPGNNPGNNNGFMGFDFGNYPGSKTYMVGVNMTF